MIFPENIPALLLVGGLGTRLQSVLPSTAKPLAPVGNAPFLQLLVRQLRSQGIRHLILCSGHMAAQVQAEFGDGRQNSVMGTTWMWKSNIQRNRALSGRLAQSNSPKAIFPGFPISWS